MEDKGRTPRADRAPRDQVGDELRRDRVEQLARRRDAHVGDLEEETAREAQALVDLVRAVELRVCGRGRGSERELIGLRGRDGEEDERDAPLIRPFQPTVVLGCGRGNGLDQPWSRERESERETHLLEVDAHDDEEVVARLVGVRLEELGVLERSADVVDRAGADDL